MIKLFCNDKIILYKLLYLEKFTQMSQYTYEVNAYLLQIQQGDRSKLDDLFISTAGHLLKIARRYLNNKSLDEDAVSEAFIKINLYVDSFDCSKDGYNWMCKIVENEARTINKDEKVIAEAEITCAKLQELIAPYDILDDISFGEKLSCLDETERYVVYRRFVENESYEVIGRALNVTRAAICKRLKNIYKKLEKYLKNGKQK